MILAETYTELVTDFPHIAFELTWELITGVVFYPVIRFAMKRFHKRFDREHGIDHHDH